MKKILIAALVLIMPLIAMADTTITYIINTISGILKAVFPVLMLLAVVIFIYGIVRFIYAGGDENARKDAKNYIIYGLIGLFVIVAFWGIIQIVIDTFFGGTVPTTIPFPVVPNV